MIRFDEAFRNKLGTDEDYDFNRNIDSILYMRDSFGKAFILDWDILCAEIIKGGCEHKDMCSLEKLFKDYSKFLRDHPKNTMAHDRKRLFKAMRGVDDLWDIFVGYKRFGADPEHIVRLATDILKTSENLKDRWAEESEDKKHRRPNGRSL